MTTQAYPLSWPPGWPRTPAGGKASRYAGGFSKELTVHRAIKGLFDELQKLGAEGVILSTNMRLRGDGIPYADQRRPEDTGVAIYFGLKGREMSMAQDRFETVEQNIRSLALAIAAMRALERHGGASLMERAFRGFAALPPPGPRLDQPWWEVLRVGPDAPWDQVTEARAMLLKRHHPDTGEFPDPAKLALVQAAFEAAKKERRAA